MNVELQPFPETARLTLFLIYPDGEDKVVKRKTLTTILVKL